MCASKTHQDSNVIYVVTAVYKNEANGMHTLHQYLLTFEMTVHGTKSLYGIKKQSLETYKKKDDSLTGTTGDYVVYMFSVLYVCEYAIWDFVSAEKLKIQGRVYGNRFISHLWCDLSNLTDTLGTEIVCQKMFKFGWKHSGQFIK